jgi:hypothetical protein
MSEAAEMGRVRTTVLMLAGAMAMAAAADEARLRITHRDLVPLCLNGGTVSSGVRSWTLSPAETSLTVSIRSQPRSGQPAPEPGIAAITFAVESGHRYEVEVRADQTALSTRVWRAREWRPVVRDRTTDAIVSGDPQWLTAAGCP